jgi:multiple sugar transport system substrate-binding protein
MQSKIVHKPSRFLFCLLLTLGAGLAGCTRPPATSVDPAPLSWQGMTIKIACPDRSTATLIQRYTPGWAKKTGARVEATLYSPSAGPDTVQDASIWIIRPAELGRWASANALRPVPSDLRAVGHRYTWTGLLPLYREKLLKWADETYALPLLGDAPVFFYRADLFALARHQQAFRAKYGRDLRPPRTWEEVRDIAEYFSGNLHPGQQLPSLPPLPEQAEELDYLFETVAASCARRAILQDERKRDPQEDLFSFHFDLTTGQPRIDKPGFVRALQLLQQLQPFRPSKAQAEPAQAFANGQAVVCLAQASWIGRFRKQLGPSSIGVCQVPGSAHWFTFTEGQQRPAPADGNRVPYLGAHGWFAVVPRSAPQPDAAYALSTELTGRATSMQIVFDPDWGGSVFRDEHLSADQQWYGLELDAAHTVQLKEALHETVARPGLLNPVVELRIPDQHLYQAALVEKLRLALEKGLPAKDALHDVAAAWSRLAAGKPAELRKKDYLLSLGLEASR